MVQPISQVLADLGIEGEYCSSAVDAVERVTTQLFQIVITDWEDQPEAAFLLKTARDLKAAQRPLIIAIVGDDAKLPEALRAGANSVLVKPIRAEQVRDTMSTACELLRSKLQPAAAQTLAPTTATTVPLPATPWETSETALAAAAAASAVSAPAFVTQAPEKAFRAGEFLTSASPAPGAQFDTETECDVQKSLDQAAASEIDALTELEPMAAAVENAAAEPPQTQTALTGWAALQARLTKPIVLRTVEETPARSELLSYGETPSYKAPLAEPSVTDKDPAREELLEESGPEAALFAYMSGELDERAEPAERPGSKRGKVLLVAALAVACVVLMAVPRTRRTLQMFYHVVGRAGGNWLNPPPAPLPQAVAQHDSFGQSGDEYKLPTTGNIPDATTDPSQIRVLPVIDPTAKTEKGPEANGGQAQATTGESNAADQNQTNKADQNQPGQSHPEEGQSGQAQIKNSTPPNTGAVPGIALGASSATAAAAAPVLQPLAPPPRQVTPAVRSVAPPRTVSEGSGTGIPSSLKSQMASSTPDASGNKPVEAAMSAIEPVNLPESSARELLTQPVDPEYPAAARASGQRGSVVLQVVIGRDGAVQDTKFLQGSLVFARAAIDAVRQWRFKPYSMNGRAVSVQSVITLNFKPPA